jgi:hypothetical protein
MEIVFVLQPAAYLGGLESDQPAHSAGIGAALAFAALGERFENWKDLLNTWHLFLL